MRAGSAALLIGIASVSASDPSIDRASAAAAFEAGEYSSAIRFYSKSREAAARSGDDKSWIADTVAMARAYLHMGDRAQADRLLKEFNRRFSGGGSGILAGEILAAEGRVGEAKAFFRKLASDKGADATSRGEAALALTYLQLVSGSAAETAEALKTLESLERNIRFATEARLRRIHALICLGQDKKALKLAEEISFGDTPEQRRLELLKLLAMLHTGDADGFASGWSRLRGEIPPRPDHLAFDTLDQAAEAAVKSSRPDRAEFYWNDAYGFADGDDARRDTLRKLFNCCAGHDAHAAAAVAKRYIENFPDDTDEAHLTERARILSGAGRALCAAGANREALEFFRMVADDGMMSFESRRSAAGDAALAAEKAGDHETAKHFFESLVTTARNPQMRQAAQMFYAEYLLRQNDFAGAERLLRGMGDVTSAAHRDRAARLLVKALTEQKKYDAALGEAEKLRRSPDPAGVGFGEFHAARLTEKLGRREEARKRYLNYIKLFPKGEFVRPALFSAAKMAEESGDCATAAKEFFAYGTAYPDDPDLASVLFWALRDGAFAGDMGIALKSFESLTRMVGVGPEYYAAALQLADFMRRSGTPAEALALLDKVDRSKCGSSESAMLDLMRARVLIACRRKPEALAAAEKILNDHPGAPAAADAAFLAGDLHLESDAPDKALPLLLRAYKLRPSGAFGEAVALRIAECRLQLYGGGKAPQELDAAAEAFERLSGGSVIPGIRLMCHYKLGYCRELQNKPRAAFDAYYQALLYAGELKRAHISLDPKWCSRSAYAALNLLLRQRWSDADQRGAAVINAVKALGLPGGAAEFESVRKQFNERYLNNREI